MTFYHIAQAIEFKLLWRYDLDKLPKGEASKLPTPDIGEVMFSLVAFIHSDRIGKPHTKMRNYRSDE